MYGDWLNNQAEIIFKTETEFLEKISCTCLLYQLIHHNSLLIVSKI